MTEEYTTRRALRELSRRPSRRAWITRWVLIGVGAALIILVAWVGVRALIAKAELESALPKVSQIKDDLKAVDLDAAQATIGEVASSTANARALTSDPIWRMFELIPLAGPNLTGFRELAAIADDIVANVMLPVASLGDTLDPSALKPVDGRIDPTVFDEAEPVISAARQALEQSYQDVLDLDTSATVAPIAAAHKQVEGMLAPLVPVMGQADDFVKLLPGLLGADGPRTYLLVFQNNSESRALGGHAGSWVEITVDNGKISLNRQSSVHELKTGGVPPIALPSEQLAVWPGAGQDPSNVTMVPRLDQSAETAAAFWAKKFGSTPDLVIFVDPVALGYILSATGPIELPTGDIIDSETAGDFLLNGVYLKYPDPTTQDLVFNTLASTLFGSVLGGNFDPAKAAQAALRAGDEHRLLIWSFDTNEQDTFKSLPFDLSTPQTTEARTEFGVYITDNLGSKMTYYVDAQVELGHAQCSTGDYQYAVRVTLKNIVTAEEGPLLPTYVANISKGALRVLVTIYAPPGSSIVRELAVGWDPTYMTLNGADGEYPVMTQRVILNPEESVTGTFIIATDDADLDKKLGAYVTPLARPIPVSEFDFTC